MARRNIDSSIPSTIREDAEVADLFVDLEVEEKPTTQQVLYRALSLRTVVSTHSSNAERQQKAATNPDDRKYSKIGFGSCGEIFQQFGTSLVVKKAKADDKALWNDLLKHQLIIEAFTRQSHLTAGLKIPKAYEYIGYRTEIGAQWWVENSQLFPEEDSLPANLLFSERIRPLPQSVREALVDRFFHSLPQEQRNMILKKDGNKNCLIRLYCGRRRAPVRPGTKKVLNQDIRNYPFFLDQMSELELDIQAYAVTMADALAVMHWIAKVDARDVEFVLGSSPVQSHSTLPSFDVLKRMPSDSSTHLSTSNFEFRKRKVNMWLLDFNQVKDISMNAAGVRQAVSAFRENDPYFPRPSRSPQATNDPIEKAIRSHDEMLWQAFSQQYLSTSRELVKDQKEARNLPELFIQQVCDTQMQHFAAVDADTGGSYSEVVGNQ